MACAPGWSPPSRSLMSTVPPDAYAVSSARSHVLPDFGYDAHHTVVPPAPARLSSRRSRSDDNSPDTDRLGDAEDGIGERLGRRRLDGDEQRGHRHRADQVGQVELSSWAGRGATGRVPPWSPTAPAQCRHRRRRPPRPRRLARATRITTAVTGVSTVVWATSTRTRVAAVPTGRTRIGLSGAMARASSSIAPRPGTATNPSAPRRMALTPSETRFQPARTRPSAAKDAPFRGRAAMTTARPSRSTHAPPNTKSPA